MINTMVEYKGGGFDGCHWQWNYFMFDEGGTFHNLFSSGRKGVKTELEAQNLLADPNREHYSVKVTVYDMSVPAEMHDFVDGMVASTVKQLDAHMAELTTAQLRGHCTECDDLHPVSDMNAEDWTGDGHGIEFFAMNLYCSMECANAD